MSVAHPVVAADVLRRVSGSLPDTTPSGRLTTVSLQPAAEPSRLKLSVADADVAEQITRGSRFPVQVQQDGITVDLRMELSIMLDLEPAR